MRAVLLSLLTLLACGLAGCSRSQKTGTAISAQDIAKAMPEFTMVMPPGAKSLYLQQIPGSPITSVYFKLTVPRASLTNFLTLSGLNGFNGTFLPLPAGTLPRQAMPLPGGLDLPSAVNWVSDVHHSAEWDPGKGNVPLLMTCVETSAKSTPRQQVLMLVLMDNSTSPQAMVYLEYHRVPKRR